MKPSTFAPRALVAALVLGVVADWLLDARYWAANVAVFVLLLVAVGAILTRKAPNRIPNDVKWLALVIVIFGLCFAWRDSPEMRLANGVALTLAIGIILFKVREGQVAKASVVDYTLGITGRWFLCAGEAANLVGPEMDWKNRYGATGVKKASSIAAGLAIATPLILLFGALFASADAVFNNAVLTIFSIDPEELMRRSVISIAVAWFIAGAFQRILSIREFPAPLPPPLPDTPKLEPSAPPRLGFTEIAIPMSALVALFTVFVAIQFRYLFGGNDIIRNTVGLTYSQYARKGFYELVAVATAVLVIVIAARSLLDAQNEKQERGFKALATALITLTFVVIASALNRMYIMVDLFGFTMLRFYPSAFMAWLAIAFSLLIFTVVRKQHDRFAFRAALAGFATIFAVNVMNPDNFIARYNMSPERKESDVTYLLQLSDDAVPAIADALPRLNPDDTKAVIENFKARRNTPIDDPREWNISRLQAAEVLNAP